MGQLVLQKHTRYVSLKITCDLFTRDTTVKASDEKQSMMYEQGNAGGKKINELNELIITNGSPVESLSSLIVGRRNLL